MALTIGVLVTCLLFVDTAVSRRIDRKLAGDRRQTVKLLGLTDLCLFTEAPYSRHPAMAVRQSAFQEHPLALDHFPSGSLVSVPPQLRLRSAR